MNMNMNIIISVTDGCEEGIRHGDQCYIANNVKGDKMYAYRVCRELGGGYQIIWSLLYSFAIYGLN